MSYSVQLAALQWRETNYSNTWVKSKACRWAGGTSVSRSLRTHILYGDASADWRTRQRVLKHFVTECKMRV